MAASNRRDLYLQVGGDVTSLQAAAKAGRSALLSLGTAANDVHAEVEKAFADMASNAPASAKALEQSYTQTFNVIRANAKAVLSAPNSGAALNIIDANAAQEVARAAEQQASALRQVATAAAQVAGRAGEAAAAERVLAVAAAANATQAEQEAVALRNQANLLSEVSGELQRMGVAQTKNVTVNGQAKAGYQQLSYQIGDVATQYASGTSASIIFAQQSGQVIQAISLITGEAKGFLGVLGGPWGIAMSSALVVLSPFVGKLIEGGNALKKETDHLKENAEKTAIAEQAKEAFLKTEAGAIEDVRALTEEIKKQNDALLTNAERLNIRSKNRLETLTDRRTDVAGDLADARERRDAAMRSSSQGSDVAFERANKEVVSLEAKLKRVDQALAAANAARLETQKDLAAEAAKRAGDPLEQIRRKYEGANGLIEQAKKQASAEEVTNGVLLRRLALLGRQQKAETDAVQKRQAAEQSAERASARGDLTPGAVGDLLKDRFGGTVTSTTGGKHVKGSYHYRGQAVDYVPQGGVGAISKQDLRALLEQAGVPIKELLGPGDKGHSDHFHVAFGKTRRDQETVDGRAATRERAAEAAEQKRSRDAEAYEQLKLRADEQALQLKRQQVVDIATAADLDVQAVDIERQRLDSALDAGVEQKRWTQAQADAVKAVNKSNAQLKTTAIRDAQSQRLLDQQLSTDRDALAAAATLLQLQGNLATTNRERRRIALELLSNDEATTRADANRLLGSTNPADWVKGEGMLRQITAERPGRVEQINRQTADPLEEYRQQLQDATGDMDVALQGVAVRGFQEMEDGLAGLIDGTESVGSAFKKMASGIIADLARIAIQKAILSFIPGVGGFLGLAATSVQSNAEGGLITGPGHGTSDDILSWLSNGEFVMTAAATRRHLPVLRAMNDNHLPAFATGGLVGTMPTLPSIGSAQRQLRPATPSGSPIVFDMRHAVMTADLLSQMQEISARNATVSIVAGSRLAQDEMAEQRWAQIP